MKINRVRFFSNKISLLCSATHIMAYLCPCVCVPCLVLVEWCCERIPIILVYSYCITLTGAECIDVMIDCCLIVCVAACCYTYSRNNKVAVNPKMSCIDVCAVSSSFYDHLSFRRQLSKVCCENLTTRASSKIMADSAKGNQNAEATTNTNVPGMNHVNMDQDDNDISDLDTSNVGSRPRDDIPRDMKVTLEFRHLEDPDHVLVRDSMDKVVMAIEKAMDAAKAEVYEKLKYSGKPMFNVEHGLFTMIVDQYTATWLKNQWNGIQATIPTTMVKVFVKEPTVSHRVTVKIPNHGIDPRTFYARIRQGNPKIATTGWHIQEVRSIADPYSVLLILTIDDTSYKIIFNEYNGWLRFGVSRVRFDAMTRTRSQPKIMKLGVKKVST